VQQSAGNDVDLQQAMKRVELQVASMTVAGMGQPGATAVQARTAVMPGLAAPCSRR